MVKRFIFIIVVCTGIWGCSSPTSRAPVTDLMSEDGQKTAKSTKAVVLDLTSAANKRKSTNGSNEATKRTTRVIPSISKSDTYKVKSGDTLYSVAWNLSTDIKVIAERNNIKPPYTIYKGQVLNLKDNKVQNTIVKSTAASQKISKQSKDIAPTQKKVNSEVVLKKAKGYSSNNDPDKTVQKKSPPKKVVAEKTVEQKIRKWSWPAKGKVTESFSASQAGMKGISIANQRGTGIYAAAAGQVVYAGSGLQGYGNLIIIKHNYDYLSAYAHNETLLVNENEQIAKGQKIALMGDSDTDNVNLHFEIRYRGKSVDPQRYLGKR